MIASKIALAALAASTVAAGALPAAAQSFDRGYAYAPRIEVRIDDDRRGFFLGADCLHEREDRLGEWIGRARAEGRLPDWQARRMWDALRSVKDEERGLRWRQGGRLYPDQFARLDARLDRLSFWLRDAQRDRHDDWRPWDR
jgi:hypothetical protein